MIRFQKHSRLCTIGLAVLIIACVSSQKEFDVGKQNEALTESGRGVIARDGYYEKLANGIIRDTKNSLEWYSGPDEDQTWFEAKNWVESLSIDGGGWRMPTINELKSLFEKGTGSWNMTKLLKTTGWIVWSGETKGSYAGGFKFFGFGNESWSKSTNSFESRAFAVRSRK